MSSHKVLILLTTVVAFQSHAQSVRAQLNNAPLYYWNFDTAGATSYVDLVQGISLNDTNGSVGDVANPIDSTNAIDFSNGAPYLLSANLPQEKGNRGAYAIVVDLNIPTGQAAAYIASGFENNPSLITNFGGATTVRLHSHNGSGATVAADTWQRIAIGFYGSDTSGNNSIDNNAALDDVKISVNGGAPATIAASTQSLLRWKQFIVGQSTLGDNYQGLLDNLGFYDLSRSGTSEVQLDQALTALSGGTQRDLNIPGVTYTYTGSITPHASYLDTSGVELTDNASNPTTSATFSGAHSNPEYVGFQNSGADNGLPQPEVVFDLNGLYNLQDSQIHYLVNTGLGIHAPDSVTFEFSTDGVNFSNLLSSTNFTNSNLERISTFNLAGQTASFVRVRLYSDAEWLFLSDVRFFGTLVPVPEPCAFVLCALGVFAACRMRKDLRRS